MAKNKLVLFPNPFGRIPNFEGTEEASARLLELDVFKEAKSIEVNPDKPLAPARALVLSNQKDLYVPFPRLQECLMKKLELDEKLDVKMVVSRWGIEYTGAKIEVKDKVKIDLLIVGSVAVSKQGYRIGKGAGYADLEFGIFKETKAITDDTVIVTIVHDSQVFDELPQELFEKYDVPVDYIVTPTRTIKIEKKLPRPEGVFWNELTKGQLKGKRILQDLKQKHQSEGRDTTLKVLNPGERPIRRPFFWRRFAFKRRQNRNYQDKPRKDQVQNENPQNEGIPRRTVKFQEPNTEGAKDNQENVPPQIKNKKKKKKPHIDYSLRVSNIQRNVRVRDFKNALREKGIKPNNITWKGSRGFCYLHYAKKNQKKEDENSDAINSVIEMIQDLKINSNAQKNLNVKVMEPITRIETVDVTAV